MWKKAFKITAKIVLGIFLFLIFIVTAVVISLAVWQQEIVPYAINKGLEKFDPSIKIEKIEVSAFKELPTFWLNLEQVYVPGTIEQRDTALLECEALRVEANVTDLLKGNLGLEKARIHKGDIHLFIAKDGSTNFDFGKKDTTQQQEEVPEAKPSESKGFAFDIKDIALSDVNFTFTNREGGQEFSVSIDTLHTPLMLTDKYVQADAYARLTSNELNTGELILLPNTPLFLDGKVYFGFEETHLKTDSVHLEAGPLALLVDGELKSDSLLYLDFRGKTLEEEQISEIFTIVPDQFLESIDMLEIDGSIDLLFELKGTVDTAHIPTVTAQLAMRDGTVAYPEKNITSKDINFNAKFMTGDDPELSEGYVALEDFSADYRGNPLSGTVEVQNFQAPLINAKIDVDADLASFQGLVEEQGVEVIKGKALCHLIYRGSLEALQSLRTLPKGEVSLTAVEFKHEKYPNLITLKDSRIDFEPEALHLQLNELAVGRSKVKKFETKLEKPLAVYKKNQDVSTEIVLRAPYVDIDQLSGKKPEPGEEPKILKNLMFDAHAGFSSEKVLAGETPKEIKLNLSLFHFEHDTLQHDFRLNGGNIHLQENRLVVEQLRGNFDRSDFLLNLRIDDLQALQNQEQKDTFAIALDLRSKDMDIKQMSGGKSSVSKLENLILKLHLQASNEVLNMKDDIPYVNLEIDTLGCREARSGKQITLDPATIKAQNELIEISSLHAVIGKSELKINARISHAQALLKDDYKHTNIFARMESDHLNTNEIKDILAPESTAKKEEPADTTQKEPKEPVLLSELPKFDVVINMKELTVAGKNFDYFEAEIKNINKRTIVLEPFRAKAQEGGVNGMAIVEQKVDNSIVLRSNFDINDFIIDNKLLGEIETEEERIEVTGIGNADITTNLIFDKFGEFNTKESKAVVQFKLYNGRVKNFKPLMLLGIFFETSELNDIKFDTLINIVDLDDELINIPGMWIRTNAGDIFIRGKQTLDGYMDYHIALPFRLMNTAPMDFINNMPRAVLVETPQKILSATEGSVIWKIFKAVKLNMLRDVPNKVLLGADGEGGEESNYVKIANTKLLNSQLFVKIQGTPDDLEIGYDEEQFTDKWKKNLIDNPSKLIKDIGD